MSSSSLIDGLETSIRVKIVERLMKVGQSDICDFMNELDPQISEERWLQIVSSMVSDQVIRRAREQPQVEGTLPEMMVAYELAV